MDFKDYLITHRTDFFTLGIVLIILYFVFKLLDYTQKRIYNEMVKRDVDNLLVRFLPLLNKILKLLLALMIILPICEKHGINVSSILTAVGVGGVAIGFAAKETIADLFGSISLIADKVFKVGDYIVVNQSVKGKDVEGVVEEINFHSTKIRGIDDTLCIIPNNITANSVVTNVSEARKRRINEIIGLTYNTPIENVKKAIETIKQTLLDNEKISDDGILVKFDKYADSSVDIFFCAYTKSSAWIDYMEAKHEVLMNIFEKFNLENIEFAFPSRTIYVKKEV